MKYHFFRVVDQQSIILCIPLLAISIASVQAKEIYFQPSINIRTEFDDNKQLRTEESLAGIDLSSYGIITAAVARAGVRSNRYEVSLDNKISINRYKSEFDLDSDDYNFNLSSSYNVTERSRLGLNGSYTRDTTLTSELEDTGTGFVQNNLNRQQWSITPDWSYSLSNTQFLQASYTHSEIDYEESARSSLADYSIDNVSFSFSQQWTPLLSNNLSVTAMSFRVPKINSGQGLYSSRDTTEYSVNLGADYQISPTWSTSLSVGKRFTNTETTQLVDTPFEQATSDDVTGLVFSLSVDKKFEAGSANVRYSRSTNAQGNGLLQVQDIIAANYTYKYSPTLQFSLNGSAKVTSSSGSEDDGNDRNNFSISPSLRWEIDRQVSLTANYRYRAQTFEINDEKAESNLVSLTFNYQWNKFKTQRY